MFNFYICSFIGDVCIAKATRDIQEGEPIFRAHMGVTYFKYSNEEREVLLKNCSIQCSCLACSNINFSKVTSEIQLSTNDVKFWKILGRFKFNSVSILSWKFNRNFSDAITIF